MGGGSGRVKVDKSAMREFVGKDWVLMHKIFEYITNIQN